VKQHGGTPRQLRQSRFAVCKGPAYASAADIDRRAIEAVGSALGTTGKPFVAVSVTMLLTPGKVGTEQDPPLDDSPARLRKPSEEAVLSFAHRGVRASVVRLPPVVHGAGDEGMMPDIMETVRRNGFSAYIGDGTNRWCAAHRVDVARLFVKALLHASPGERFHATAEEGVSMRSIAETLGIGMKVPVRSLGKAEAREHFGEWLARFVAIDNPISSVRTRQRLDWVPQEYGLLEDLLKSGYFA
jgi:nucleoside-diphosphate-sugar epimerase